MEDLVAFGVTPRGFLGKTNQGGFVEVREGTGGLRVVQQAVEGGPQHLVGAFGGSPGFVWGSVGAWGAVVRDFDGPLDVFCGSSGVDVFFARGAVRVGLLEPFVDGLAIRRLVGEGVAPMFISLLWPCRS